MTAPIEILNEFLFAVVRCAAEMEEEFVPVLRGSLLLHHWYGSRARQPGDIDLECFDRHDLERNVDSDEEVGSTANNFPGERIGRRFGSGGEFISHVDLGKAMCRYGAEYAEYTRPGGDCGIRFSHDDSPPADGTSLWTYGTPGERYYATWESTSHTPSSGRLQLDLAAPVVHSPADLSLQHENLVAPGGESFSILCYSREAMLAAKVSWLVRSFVRHGRTLRWTGELKDLFDAHLLAGDSTLRPEVFRRSMQAICVSDGLTWTDFDHLFEVRRIVLDDGLFANWPQFVANHPNLTMSGPVELWTDLTTCLAPLLGNIYPVEEVPFLRAIHKNPSDTLPLLVFADWLEERSDFRSPIVRLVSSAIAGELAGTARTQLAAALDPSQPWPHLLFGTSNRLAEFRSALRENG